MQNILKVAEMMRGAERSLDVGGWHRPLNGATHVLDVNDYDSRLTNLAWDLDGVERFTRNTWVQRDICDRNLWPFPDNYFDFVCCSHVLEDIRDPVWVVSEMCRVGRSGYIECPAPGFELLMHTSLWALLLQRPNGSLGNAHHRWFVEIIPQDQLAIFRLKPHNLIERKRFVQLSRLHRVNYPKSTSWMFWEGDIRAEEAIFDIGDWIDSVALPEAKSLISFDPIGRTRDKFERIMRRCDYKEIVQPKHGEKCKYPYY